MLVQRIEINDTVNIVPTYSDATCFSRTPQQVLRIVYEKDKSGVSQRAMFPDGMIGNLKTT